MPKPGYAVGNEYDGAGTQDAPDVSCVSPADPGDRWPGLGTSHPEMQRWILRIHVMLVSLWLCTFAAPAALAATGPLDWHRRVGPWGFRVGAVWIVSALLALAVLLTKTRPPGRNR